MPQDSQGRYYEDPQTVAAAAVASAARTTTGTGSSFSTGEFDELIATLVITAASGTTPTMDITLETTADGTNYYAVTMVFPQQTTTNTGISRVFGGLGSLSRWKWTIAGTTPSFTFSIAATAQKI